MCAASRAAGVPMEDTMQPSEPYNPPVTPEAGPPSKVPLRP
jgi:hypothetical protein